MFQATSANEVDGGFNSPLGLQIVFHFEINTLDQEALCITSLPDETWKVETGP